MPFESAALASAVGFVVALLVLREVSRRLGVSYEYRWETFAVRGPRGRQLLHIRKSEIQSIEPLPLKDRIWRVGGFKRLPRTSFARQVVIRSNVAHARPVVVSWEGRLIAGMQPEGYRLRPEETGRKG